MGREPKNTVETKIVVEQHSTALVDEGNLFRQAYKYDVSSGGTAYMLINSGTKYPHIILSAIADGDVQFEIFAVPTISDTGAEEPTGNFNFNSTNTMLTKWYPTPSVTDDGVYIGQTWIFGGSGVGTPAGAEGSATLSKFDIVLIPSVDFLIKMTNFAGRSLQLFFEAVCTEKEYDYSP